MMMRAKFLLFAAVAVGLVVLMGGALVRSSFMGRQAQERALSADAQVMILGELRLDAAIYVQSLLDAIETRRSPSGDRDSALRRVDEAFRRMRELAEQEKEAGGASSERESAQLEEVRRAQSGWVVALAELARETTPEESMRFLDNARRTFAHDVEPLLLRALERESTEKADILQETGQAFRAGELVGVVVPLGSMLFVGGLALTMLVPLRRALRDFVVSAERVGQGDFEQLLSESREDEYGLMARSFNRMARQVRDLIAERQRRAREEAEASERETRRNNVLLEETVRERTAELEQTNARLIESLQRLQAAQAQLLFADRLASVGQLAAGIGHEINNPLAFIISNLDWAQEELQRMGGGTERQCMEVGLALKDAREGAERVRLIVRELRDLARPESLESGPVDLGAVVRSAEKMAIHLIRQRARLVLEVDGAPPVLGNGARLCQVMLNLLLNAAHALEPGGAGHNTIRVSARALGAERVQVEVSDTGCGIPPENLARIFDPFFTTRPVGMGTGMGLAVCHGIIASHGGEISVESELGKGSTFRVTLPVFAKGARPAPHVAAVPVTESTS
ncbi:HAMP domain-containing protein [Pyxidicoccus parkwayensis]|uniref:histidine kinase n=1 Tax=Pyxidicoccus parkwayensis TaxID=2813578 RepID=A0ABX7P2R7_9BACT|nr:ATP-binding protein [Pyxidicoccus parkwaysis]QSQ24747.1 HAMP domain-containing protein [Pyxidicoccus parkwaysis]